LELAQRPLGLRSELSVRASCRESLPRQCLLDLPDLSLARVFGCVLTGIFVRRPPAGLHLVRLLLRLMLLRLRRPHLVARPLRFWLILRLLRLWLLRWLLRLRLLHLLLRLWGLWLLRLGVLRLVLCLLRLRLLRLRLCLVPRLLWALSPARATRYDER
jgi:hypothetical protein